MKKYKKIERNFILTLHSLSTWNELGRIQGQTDLPLSKMGEKNARDLALILRKYNAEAIYCSDLKRSQQTANIVSSILKLPVIASPDLRECSFGSAEGKTKNEIMNLSPASLKDSFFSLQKYSFKEIGGESRQDVIKRLHNFFNSFKDDGTFIIIGHRKISNTLLDYIGKEPSLKKGDTIFLKHKDYSGFF